MLVDPPGKRCANRLFEWVSALGMAFYGAHIVINPASLSNSRYSAVLVLFAPLMFGFLCLVTGLLRLFSLWRNGAWPVWGPRWRVILAFLSAMLWLQVAVALMQWLSPGMWIYFSLFAGELRSVWRAMRDANAARIR